ncbi:MAG: thioredoxin family protein [Candidatus Hermodarchaeota archaeon]
MVTQATTAMFSSLIEGDKPLIVDMYSDWCMPCKFAAPHFERLSKKYGDNAVFVKVNVDQEPAIASALRVQGVPSFFIIKNRKVVSLVVGADMGKLEAEIKKNLIN